MSHQRRVASFARAVMERRQDHHRKLHALCLMDGQHPHRLQRLLGQRALCFLRLLGEARDHELDEPGQREMRPVGEIGRHLPDLEQVSQRLLAMQGGGRQFQHRQPREQ